MISWYFTALWLLSRINLMLKRLKTQRPIMACHPDDLLLVAEQEVPTVSFRNRGCPYLMVYNNVPSSVMRRSLLGMVILWATDFFPLWKNVSGVQILLAMRLFNRRTVMGPLNFNLSSFQLWRKNTSIVYSW